MRITGGIFRSRTLLAPRGQATRPTSDRVREALFGILTSAGVVAHARVLDLYAGTGALGLEALSRGAARVTLVESAAGAIAAIRQNISALGVEKCARLIAGDVARAERRLARDGPFDLVVADPPWSLVESGDAPRTLAEVLGTRLMTSEAWLVLEHSARIAAPGIGRLVRFETRHYGDAALTFYKPAILGPPRTDVRAGPPSD